MEKNPAKLEKILDLTLSTHAAFMAVKSAITSSTALQHKIQLLQEMSSWHQNSLDVGNLRRKLALPVLAVSGKN
jgi:hypothetical protein